MLEKAYDPKAVEDRIYTMWEESGVFKADVNSTKEPFTISMPPPNATGTLHLGHASMLALQDIFIRFARMNGKEALWVPGTDHAAIATESVVIKKIQKEDKVKDVRQHLGREKLVAKIAEFVEESRGTIRSQVRKMGSSCDWSREGYTMDPALNRCVNEVFSLMYQDGLLYRGERVVNWDIALQTTISDDEIEYKDTEATLYTMEYLTAAQTGGEPVFVATSRPETKLGDSGLVVHPDDERYKHLIGKTFEVQWPRGQKISVVVIADHTVDPAFGTGVLGLTPYHSKIDYELWQRHKAEFALMPLHVIGEDGRMTGAIEGYGGMTIEECREAFVADLKEAGRISKETKYMQPLSVSYRSKKAVEPLPKTQWFIDVNKQVVDWKGKKQSLKQIMQDCVQSEMIEIIPERFGKTYFQWIDNLQDWCVSRQIWWGHRIPAWYKDGETYVGVTPPQGTDWKQDEDTLDTWFSSALWTWSTLIDPTLAEDPSLSLADILQGSPDFKKFHPTNVMETGGDILFFWVARMILMTTYALGKIPGYAEEQRIPFKTVYLHGMIMDRNGQKMSKSKPETAIDPLEIIPKYGADALRLSMIVGQSPGNDSRLYEEKIEGYRNFVNKLWNASRFVLMQCEKSEHFSQRNPKSIIFNIEGESLFERNDLEILQSLRISRADEFILLELQNLIKDVTYALENFNLSAAGERLYAFIWNDFCDWYLECNKVYKNDAAVPVHVIRTVLRLLHPFCPFVTEELWSHFCLEDNKKMLAVQEWPEVSEGLKKWLQKRNASENFRAVMDVVTLVRKIRSEYDVEPSRKIAARVVADESVIATLQVEQSNIMHMSNLDSLIIQLEDAEDEEDSIAQFTHLVEVYVPLGGLIDKEKEKAKLLKEKENLERFAKGIEAKLGNEQFVSRAPAELIADQKQKLAETQEKLAKIEERLKAL